MKCWKYVVIAAIVIGLLVVAGAGCSDEPAKPKTDTEERSFSFCEGCRANAIKADMVDIYSDDIPMLNIGKQVYVEGEVRDFKTLANGNCCFIVDSDGGPWLVDTFESHWISSPGVESNCYWIFDGREVKVWGYLWFWGPIPEDVTEPCFFEIAACEIERR